jgi:aminoglycoside phosphotransferase (APT) family kinase protein
VRKPAKVLRTDLAEHPAVRAWSGLSPTHALPDHLVILKRKAEGAVVRLAGVGPEGRAVIAKRCRFEKAVIERAVYEQVLPRLPLPSLDYHGSVAEEDGRFVWLFLEDVGDERYTPEDREHRELAARWLACLHTTALGADLRGLFPERGPDHYRGELRAIRATLPQGGSLPTPSPRGTGVLDRIASLCERLESSWSGVDALCEKAPRALVHGDCLAKNVHFRGTGAGRRVAPFDWGGAGIGVAATDLGQLALPRRGPPDDAPDHAAYLDVARRRWPELEFETVRQLAELGQLFWALKVIRRAIPELDCNWARPGDVLHDLAVYEAALARSFHALGAEAGALRPAGPGPARPAARSAPPREAIQADADEHAALLAWRSLAGGRAEPDRIDVLKRDRAGTLVCRLQSGGDPPVIAKRSPRESAAIERNVYEEILAELPVASPRYHGAAEEPESGFCWLFLEEVSGRRYHPERESHRAAAARWLGALHRSSARLQGVPALPARSPEHYWELLRRGSAALGRRLDDAEPRSGGRAVIEAVLGQLERLAARWSELERACDGAPQTLVHGDFVDHNARVQEAPSGLVFLAFDWEKAGWGVPAEDLASVDLAAYRAAVGDRLPRLEPDALRRLASAGRIFRCLVFLDWATSGRSLDRVDQETEQIGLCGAWLDPLLQRGAWRV